MAVSDFELVELLDDDILYGEDEDFGLDVIDGPSGSSNILKTTGLVAGGVVLGVIGTHLFKMFMGSGNKMGAGHMGAGHMGAGHMNQMGAGHMGGHSADHMGAGHMGAGHMNIFGAGHMGGHHK